MKMATGRISPEITRGLHDVLPIVLAYIPVGATFGVLARSQGLSPLLIMLCSAVIYSGAAQFIFVSLVTAGIAPVSMIVTIILVNIRHIIYGATLGPQLKGWKEWHKWLISFGLTDEVFAVTAGRLEYKSPSPAYQAVVSLLAYASWLCGSALGAGAGQFIPPVIASLLAFALPALFLALWLAPRKFWHVVTGLCAALAAVLAHLAGFSSLEVIVGALTGATIGWLLSRHFSTPVQEKTKDML